jgi:hypothetical protein
MVYAIPQELRVNPFFACDPAIQIMTLRQAENSGQVEPCMTLLAQGAIEAPVPDREAPVENNAAIEGPFPDLRNPTIPSGARAEKHMLFVEPEAEQPALNLAKSEACLQTSSSCQPKEERSKKLCGRKRKFTAEEEDKLLELVRRHGTSNWSTIALELPGKNRKQIREYYINFLQHPKAKAGFTAAEDKALLEHAWSRGQRWQSIIKYFPNHTVLAIKNRYRHLVHLLAQGADLSQDTCRAAEPSYPTEPTPGHQNSLASVSSIDGRGAYEQNLVQPAMHAQPH